MKPIEVLIEYTEEDRNRVTLQFEDTGHIAEIVGAVDLASQTISATVEWIEGEPLDREVEAISVFIEATAANWCHLSGTELQSVNHLYVGLKAKPTIQ